MASIRNQRTHRALSSYLNTLNKENHLDFGNRAQVPHKKGLHNMISQDPASINKDHLESKLPPHKPLSSLRAKESMIQFQEKRRLEENNMIANDYGYDILQTLLESNRNHKLNNVLVTHNIPKDLRCRMIDWMIEVIGSFKFDQQAFFTAVRLMDTFFMKTTKPHQPQEVHLTGVTCMYMATKFEEVHPLKLKTVYEKIGHRKLSTESILQKESEILDSLDFVLTGVNHHQITSQLIFMTNIESRIDKKLFEYMMKVCMYLSKMVLFEMEIITEYSYEIIAIANLYVAFKTMEQGCSEFNADVEIRESLEIMGVGVQEVMEAAAKILSIAKSFDKVHHSLKNLKKFNGFSFEHGSTKRQKPVTSR